MRFNDAVFGVLLLVVGIALFVYSQTLPELPGQDFGPSLMPSVIAVGFAVCGAILVLQGRRTAGAGLVQLSPWTRSGGHLLDVGLVIGGLVLLILVWNWVGFLIGGSLYAGLLITRFRGGRLLTSFALAIIACVVVDWGFRHLLLVPLPLGPLAPVIW